MNRERRDLARRLFVVATEILEGAHEIVVAGQSPSLNTRRCLNAADSLRAIGGDLIAVASAVAAIAKPQKR